ncbi:carboxypeptidase-like regulatory domain-containing protein [Cyclobacterium qasimii]|nr:carboxypeptidase-like regulatory domain-containing protein [Cyclobacterium qasimii]EPR68680.1 TonB-dependent receptor [Cyclobacterium qasimii M12-11B]
MIGSNTAFFRYVCFLFVFVFFSSSFETIAQDISQVSGQVFDGESGEPLPGAAIYWENQPSRGTVTDQDGFFSLPVASLPNNLNISFLGYKLAVRSFKNKDELVDLKFF